MFIYDSIPGKLESVYILPSNFYNILPIHVIAQSFHINFKRVCSKYIHLKKYDVYSLAGKIKIICRCYLVFIFLRSTDDIL